MPALPHLRGWTMLQQVPVVDTGGMLAVVVAVVLDRRINR
jgi:hypothetical protein